MKLTIMIVAAFALGACATHGETDYATGLPCLVTVTCGPHPLIQTEHAAQWGVILGTLGAAVMQEQRRQQPALICTTTDLGLAGVQTTCR